MTASTLTVGNAAPATLTMTYDLAGNILSKSDVGTYGYVSGTHRLASIATCAGCAVNGVANPTYAYDADGNMTAGAGRTVTYTSFNMTASVNAGQSTATTLSYDDGHGRVQQVSPVGTTLYLNDGTMGVMTERLSPTGGGQNQWTVYLEAGGQIVAQRHTTGSSVSPVMTYFVLDHLGSVVATSDDETTPIVTHQYYDPWGRMRNANGTADTSCSLPSQLQANSHATRGYTNQEQMPAVCLDNYNARLYDPQLGRFLAPDPSDGSGLNRYWYVADNPLSLTDPTGLCFLGCFWKNGLVREVAAVIVAIVLQQPEFLPAAFAAEGVSAAESAFLAAGLSGGISGYIATGKLEGAGLGALQAVTFAAFSQPLGRALGNTFHSTVAGKFVANGMIGGLFSAGSKGGFAAGFLAAGFSSLADSIDLGSFATNAAVHAVAGGVGSALGGGKFANGAVTAAFAYAAESAGEELQRRGSGQGSCNGCAAVLSPSRLSYLHVAGRTLIGDIDVTCGSTLNCADIVSDLKLINHKYPDGDEIRLNFYVAPKGDIFSKLVVMHSFEPMWGDSDALGSGSLGGPISLYDGWQPNTLPHEFGHVLGFDHSLDQNSIMFKYNDAYHTYLNENEARELIDQYAKH